MPIRADILTQLADVLAELYPDQASARALAMSAGLTLGQIPFDPKASNTWFFLLTEAEAQGRTQVLLDRVSTQYPNHEPLVTAGQAYAEWVTAGRPTEQPAHTRRGTLRAPPPPDTFAGRTVELQSLTAVLLRTTTAAISAAMPGMGGVGKTTLALKLASDLAPHFPGGVVWLEAGYGAGQADLVDRLARTLGLDLAQEPLVEKRAVILQSGLASHGRVMVILDDLWDIDLGRWAGRALLPADRVLLVTSRDVALCRALCNHVQRLDVLPEAEALELLSNLLGSPGRHESAAKDLVTLLDGHPLALEIAARRCDNGVEDLPWVVRKLQAGPTLGELKLPGQESRESSVEMSLALSYDDLDPDLQQRFRTLGVFAPAPFDLAGLAAVWNDETADEAENIARPLVRRALLTQELVDDRPVYRQHMLLRAYAWALLEQAGELETTAARHLTYYATLPGRGAERWQVADVFWDQIEQGWCHAWDAGLATALSFYYDVCVFLERRGRYATHNKWASALLTLPAAQLTNKDRGTILNNKALMYYAIGQQRPALELFAQALSIEQELRDHSGEASSLNSMGLVYRSIGQPQKALELHARALSIAQETRNRAVEGATLNNMGLVYDAMGQHEQALALFEQALPIAQEVEDQPGEATTLNNMAMAYYAMGQPRRALAIYTRSATLARGVGDSVGEAMTLNNMGEIYRATGRLEQALAIYELALPIFQNVGNRAGEATIFNNMAAVYRAKDQPQRALELYERALPIAQEVGDLAGEAATFNNMAAVYYVIGQPRQALALYEQALLIVRKIPDRDGEATTLNNIGLVYDYTQQPQQALKIFKQALLLAQETGNRASEAATRFNMAMIYEDIGELGKATAHLQKVVALDEAIDHPNLERDRAALENVQMAKRAQA